MSAPYSGYQQSLGYSASKDRRIIGASMAHKNATPDDGVLLGSAGNLDCTASGFTLTVQPGTGMVAGYHLVNPAAVNRTVGATTGAARRDVLIARIYDTEAGDATSKADLELVQGTSSSADPILPQNSMILFQVDVPASGSTVTLTDRRKWTAAAGGVRMANGIASVAVADVAPGTEVFDLATGIFWYRHQSDSSKFYRKGSRRIGGAVLVNNNTVEVRATPYYAQFGPISLASPANVVMVQGTFTLNIINDGLFDLIMAWDNVELAHPVITGYTSAGDTNRTYSFTGSIADRAAGSHSGCFLGLFSGNGAVIHVKNLSYSWWALG